MIDALLMLTVLPLLIVVVPVVELKCLFRETESGRIPWSRPKRSPRPAIRLASGLQTTCALSLFASIWLLIFAVCCLADPAGRSVLDPIWMGMSRRDPNSIGPVFVALSGTALLFHSTFAPLLVLIANFRFPSLLSIPASVPLFAVACYTAWAVFHPLLVAENGG